MISISCLGTVPLSQQVASWSTITVLLILLRWLAGGTGRIRDLARHALIAEALHPSPSSRPRPPISIRSGYVGLSLRDTRECHGSPSRRGARKKAPDDYVLATNETHTVREFVDLAFRELGMELEFVGEGVEEKGVDRRSGKVRVALNPCYFRPTEVEFSHWQSGQGQGRTWLGTQH